MWKKQDDPSVQQPEHPSKERSDAAKLLSDALGRSSSVSADFEKKDVVVASEQGRAADLNQASSSPTMNSYTEAVKEFPVKRQRSLNSCRFLPKLGRLTRKQ